MVHNDQQTSQPTPPGKWLWVTGVLFPFAVIAIELVTRMCADAFFDPIPTLGHVLLCAWVPLANLLLCRALRRGDEIAGVLLLAHGAALALGLVYAIVFLPLAVMGVVAVLLFGLGLLPLAPLLAFIASVRLAARAGGAFGAGAGLRLAAGAVLGLCALALAEAPSVATTLALQRMAQDPAQSERAVALQRRWGDEQLLLRRCYNERDRSGGLLASFLLRSHAPFLTLEVLRVPSASTARELYFRVTGQAFNSVAPPSQPWRGTRWSSFAFDDAQGSTEVGAQQEGLRLSHSRIDGSVNAREALAYLEWTLEFHNSSQLQREARFTLALPPGAVASRATLWVNGVPREASFATRAAARAAYQQVVVRERRDPLLVSVEGTDQLLVQAFPVQPGESLKLRIGMSAPFMFNAAGEPNFALPAIAQRNFAIADELQHHVWIDAGAKLRSNNTALIAAPGGRVVRGALSDAALARTRPRIMLQAYTDEQHTAVQLPAAAVEPGAPPSVIVQTVARRPHSAPQRLLIVLDTSAGAQSARTGLLHSLAALPPGAQVGVMFAGGSAEPVAVAPLTPEHKLRLERSLQAVQFSGGQNNIDALADALQALIGKPDAALLWIHAAQPQSFALSAARLEQLLDRAQALPQLLLYQVSPGPNTLLQEQRWYWHAHAYPASGDAASDLRELFALTYAASRWSVQRELSAQAPPVRAGSPHIARLWGAQRVRELAGASAPARRTDAERLASALNIVTPVSSAVVLETDAEYQRNGLPAPAQDAVPTIPEPHTVALMLAGLLACWVGSRRPRGGPPDQ